MRLFRLSAAAAALVTGFAVADEKPAARPAVPIQPVAPPNPAEKFETTHKVVASIDVKGEKGLTLQTICLDGKGHVVALVAPPKPYGPPAKGATAEIHVFGAGGKPVANWKVPFHATAVNCGPDDAIYVAGDAKIAKFDAAGKQLGETAELPHVAAAVKDKEALKARAEAQLKKEKEQMAQAYGDARKSIAEQLKRIEDKKAEERSKTEVRQIEQFKNLIQQYEKIEADYKSRTVEQVIEAMTGRLRVANGMSVSEKDVFVACGDIGYGYAVWRFTKDLTDPKQILSEIGGCCGQMDIQCHGPDVLVAENTKHQFARYDREGKKVGSFGKRGDDTDPKCFGGCCNPMNIRAVGVGDIYTAESEGVIKRFSPSGEFLETAGVVKLTGGCKNVAVAVSADAQKIYFCDQPGSKFHILEKKAK
ncbi:hypothetical protein R5W23_005082 [Gemmata sp. JC673]|uniref:SMP-30/Gluconolactonase/LRE-like region domain-containing protein n=1 Tax=Gemmata algarum TaxID=2975278 RepID=A0ABU5FCD5_9BACT|nr:hypothetical protein [Gemmata algarum]MDY3563471.1 hypothetical protein [Gemmata algarum]